MKISGTLILTIVSLLERLGYYGSRTILILFALDTEGLNIGRDQYFEYYAIFSVLLLIVPVPTGLIVDKYLGQRKAVFIGGLLSLAGYCLLISEQSIMTVVSIILILVGTSLVKPSTTILIGRQFKKEDRNRTLAYILFFFGVNIGAFIGVAGIGYVGEVYAWKYGFSNAAAVTLLYLVIFYFSQKKIEEIEENLITQDNFELSLKYTLLIIPFLIILNVIYRQSYDMEHIDLIVELSNSEDRSIFNFEIVNSLLSGLSSFWTFPLTICLFVHWKLSGVPNIMKSILFSLIMLIIAIVSSQFIKTIESNQILEYSLIVFALFAIVEVVMSSILVSFLTRISDTNYSNTIYSSYYLLMHLASFGFAYIIFSEYQTVQLVTILLLTILLLIGFRKKISKLTTGVN